MDKNNIIDIFWDRIYLNIIIESTHLETNKIYLFQNKQLSQEIELESIEPNKYKAVINITNIKNGEMLKNGTYSIKFLKDGEYQNLTITHKVGYKLDELDKIYRYKKYYAYIINFEICNLHGDSDELTCTLKSSFMTYNKIPFKVKTKKASIKCEKALFNCLYKLFDLVHFNKKKKILLMSETRSPISGNLKAIDARIKERELDKEYKISYWFEKTLKMSHFNLIFKWVRLCWIISKNEKIFVDDYSPIFNFINLNKKVELIQVWHAGVGFKSVGYARFGFGGPEPLESCHRRYNYAIVASKPLIPVYSEVFGIDKEKILPYGLPRLDNFLDEGKTNKIKEHIYEIYPDWKDKKIILFAPTFRGRGQKKAHYPFEKIDLDGIYKLCKEENYIFTIKMHPFVSNHIEIPKEYQNLVFDVSDYGEINELLTVTDILITDYSSCIYDFSLFNRPILFYAFDLEKYELINRVHRPIKESAPGKICTTFNEILEAIKNNDFELEKLQKYRNENVNLSKVNASDLIIDNLIVKGENNA